MFTPCNIKKLTNVSIITLKKSNKKFELALYPNKIHDFRFGLKTDLSDILHTPLVFKNVSKAEIASKEDLSHCFPGKTNDEIITEILKQGVERKSEKTRTYELENKEKEVILFIKKKIIDSSTNKFLNDNKIRDLLKKHMISIDLRRDPKVQANEIIKIILSDKDDSLKFKRLALKIEILNDIDKVKDMWKMSIFIDPIDNKEYLYISSDEFREFKIFCNQKNIKYVIVQNNTIQEEIIC